MTSVTVRADMENNADEFWAAFRDATAALRETDPELADLGRELLRRGEVEITDPAAVERFDALVHGLPGFATGPGHAREAILFAAN